MASVESVKAQLGDKADLFDFEVEGKYVVARPKQYLTNFDECAAAFRAVGGEYMGGLGKKSHFRVPRGSPVANPLARAIGNVRIAIEALRDVSKDLKELEKGE